MMDPTRRRHTLTQPLKWHGGKHYLAKWIIGHMPPHLHYVEPFFGGGAVLLRRDASRDWYEGAEDWDGSAAQRGCSEVVNDIDGELMNFWRTLQSPERFPDFKRIMDATPFSKVEWNVSGPESTPLGQAVQFFVHARQSMAGRGDCFTPLTRNRTRGGRNAEANAWWNCVDGLADVHARLRGVVIFNECALKVIRREDGPRTLFYCDPTYVHSTRSTTKEYGKHEMTDAQHISLLKVLSGIKGKFMLSGYFSELYDRVAKPQGWRRVEKKIDNKASGAKSKEKKVECLWMNC